MKVLVRIMLISCWCHIGAVHAETEQAAARSSLGGYEWQLPEQASILLLPAYKVLTASESEAPFIRARAMQMLTLYPATSVGDFFRQQLRTMKQPVLRRRLVDNYCLVCAAEQGMQVEESVTPLLSADDAHLRVAAARCLNQLDTDSARRSLAEWVSSRNAAWEVTRAGLTVSP